MMETKNDGKDASPPHRLAKQIVRPPSARGGKSVPELTITKTIKP